MILPAQCNGQPAGDLNVLTDAKRLMELLMH